MRQCKRWHTPLEPAVKTHAFLIITDLDCLNSHKAAPEQNSAHVPLSANGAALAAGEAPTGHSLPVYALHGSHLTARLTTIARNSLNLVSFLGVKSTSVNEPEAQDSRDDQENRYDVIEQLRHYQDQDASDQRDDRLKVRNAYGHALFPIVLQLPVTSPLAVLDQAATASCV
jgi:hypothetical protein